MMGVYQIMYVTVISGSTNSPDFHQISDTPADIIQRMMLYDGRLSDNVCNGY